MSDDQQIDEPVWLREMPVRSEEIGFAPDELVECGQCRKPNGPDRTACLYCGAPVASTQTPRIRIRELEGWENGFNVIAIPRHDSDVEGAVLSLTPTLGRERELMSRQLSLGEPVPIARLDSQDQAQTIGDLLSEHRFDSRLVRDHDLTMQSSPTRLRAIEFVRTDSDQNDRAILTLFNLDENIELRPDDIALIVAGVILESRTESIERRKRKSSKTLNEILTTFDELVVDVYSRDDPKGWRVRASGFDFSCLGERKSILVGENIRALTERLVEFSPEAKLVDDYPKVRHLLEDCWPAESRRDERRLGFVKKDVSSVFTVNNATQLTKYSRMQWHLL